MPVTTGGGGQGPVWFPPTRTGGLVPEEWQRVEDNRPTLDPSSFPDFPSAFQPGESRTHATVNQIQRDRYTEQISQGNGGEALAL